MDRQERQIFDSIGKGLTETQAHMLALEVVVSALVDASNIDRDSIIARFETVRGSTPAVISERAEAVLYALLRMEAPTNGSR